MDVEGMTASPRAANGGLLRSTLGSLWPGNYPGEIALINTLINNAAIIRWPETPGDNCLHRNGLGHLDNHLPPAAVSTESLSEVLCGPARSDPGEARAQAGPIHGRGGGQRAAESQETSSREEPRLLVCQPCARPRRSNNHWPQGMRLSHLGVLCCQKQNQGPAHKRLHSQDSRGVG